MAGGVSPRNGEEMFEIVERSMTTGGVQMIYSGFVYEEDAQEVADQMVQETDEYWYEVREQRG